MSRDDVERILPGWQAASQAVPNELAEWREAHPKATLTEIEDAVFEAVQKLQAQALGEVVHASASADVAAQTADQRSPVRRVAANWSHADVSGGGCDRRASGRRWTWTALTRCVPRAEPVFFPLDEELGLLPGELSATLAQDVARLGTKMPFEQAAADLAFFWNVGVEETTVRRYTQAAGAAYVAEQTAELERLDRERPPAPDGPAGKVLLHVRGLEEQQRQPAEVVNGRLRIS